MCAVADCGAEHANVDEHGTVVHQMNHHCYHEEEEQQQQQYRMDSYHCLAVAIDLQDGSDQRPETHDVSRDDNHRDQCCHH